MGKTRKIVSVSLAVAVALGLVAYVLVPRTGPTNESVVVNQPQPTAPTTGGGSGTASGPSSGTGPSTPPGDARPAKLHGKNSEGPKHVVCLPVNLHVRGVAQYQGANWYRGQCAQAPGANAQGEAGGNGAAVASYGLAFARVGKS